MTGIVARGGTGGNHAIVTGELTLDAQPSGDPPERRVEPIERAGSERHEIGRAHV